MPHTKAIAGFFHLLCIVTPIVAMFIRSRIVVADDPAATASNMLGSLPAALCSLT